MTKTITISEETYEAIKDQLTAEEAKEINNLKDLIGETYLFQCARYIYHGKVKTVTSDYIELESASVVFSTGTYDATEAEDMQKLPNNAFVLRQSIEAFYQMNW